MTKSIPYEIENFDGSAATLEIGYYIEPDGYRETWIDDREGCTLIEAKIWLDANETEVWQAIEERNAEDAVAQERL